MHGVSIGPSAFISAMGRLVSFGLEPPKKVAAPACLLDSSLPSFNSKGGAGSQFLPIDSGSQTNSADLAGRHDFVWQRPFIVA